MSAITCVINFDQQPVDNEIIKRMTQQVAYRGPDGSSYLFEQDAGFGYLALHTTAESLKEKQPLKDQQTCRILIADARLDNREELIDQLGLESRLPTPLSDADIILSAYNKWEFDTARYLLGDFAFAIWDTFNKTLYAARDPLGCRRVHFASFGNTVCIASEAQQILQHPKASKTLDELALFEWLTGKVSDKHTMFADVKILQAGVSLKASVGGVTTWRFWEIDPSFTTRYRNVEDYKDHLLDLLHRAVEVRMRSNQNVVGCELSGGMDSTTVAAFAKEIGDKKNIQLRAVSYSFPNISTCDESSYIKSISTHLGLETRLINAEARGALDYPSKCPHSLENPWTQHLPLQDFEFQYFKHNNVNVVLTGEGGDEVFCAPNTAHYKFWRGDMRVIKEIIQQQTIRKSSWLRTIYHELVAPTEWLDTGIRRLSGRTRQENPLWPSWITKETGRRLRLKDIFYTVPEKRMLSRASQAMYQNLFHGPLFAAYAGKDFNAARHGIEIRNPLLDRRIVEFCFSIPPDLWYSKSFTKWLLREAMGKRLPEDVRWRKDKSYATDVFSCSILRSKDYIQKVFKIPALCCEQLVIFDVLREELFRQIRENQGRLSGNMGYVLSLHCWLHANRHLLQ